MSKGLILKLFFIALICSYSCTKKSDSIVVDHSSPNINYTGRTVTTQNEGVQMFWSGTSINLIFEGTSISALLEDEKGENYYNVIIDDSLYILRPDTVRRYHELASGLSEDLHSIELFKRTEFDKGKTTFSGFLIEGKPKLYPSNPSKRHIEYYGNSITAGYAVEDTSGRDSPDSTYTNNYVSYAAITARHFDADYHCICKSGIGIMMSWFPEIMPDIYDRLNPSDANSKWDFSVYTPDIVVVNLMQNDSWIVNMPEFEEFKSRFGDIAPDSAFIINAYQSFIAKIRGHHPNADIICTLGSMDASKDGSKWPGYVEAAVANLDDEKIHTHFMPYIEATAHPSIEDHEVMAKSLIRFISETVGWQY